MLHISDRDWEEFKAFCNRDRLNSHVSFWRNADAHFGLKDKSKWLIVHPTANLQRERNTFRAAQLWKVMPVSDVLTLVGIFYSAGITVKRPVAEAPRISYSGVGHERLYMEETPAVPDFVLAIYRESMQ